MSTLGVGQGEVYPGRGTGGCTPWEWDRGKYTLGVGQGEEHPGSGTGGSTVYSLGGGQGEVYPGKGAKQMRTVQCTLYI